MLRRLSIAVVLALVTAFPVYAATTLFRQGVRGDGAIQSTTNSKTTLSKCEVACIIQGSYSTTYGNACVFAIRKYASVSTGPILDDNVYPLNLTQGTHTLRFDPSGNASGNFQEFSNGAYWDDLTGTTFHNCTGYK